MNSKAIYVRVSRDDLNSDKQIPEIMKHFYLNPAEVTIFQEIESAYKEEKQKNRTEFQRLKDLIEAGHITEVYVFSTERLERNTERMFEFFFFAQANNCNIYSVLQKIIPKKEDDTPIEKMIRYFNILMYGFIAEDESYKTSRRTKQSFKKEGETTISYKGNVVGKRLKNDKGEYVELSADVINKIHKKIANLILWHEEKGMRQYYKLIQAEIYIKFKVKISKSLISKVKNGLNRIQ